jgi:hypothetical protein
LLTFWYVNHKKVKRKEYIHAREKYKWFDIKNERLVENRFDLARKQCKLHQTQIYVFLIDYMGDNSVVPMHFKFDFFQTFNQSNTK